MQLISGKFRKTHAVPILSLLIKSIPHKSVNIPEHTAPPSFTIPPPPFILDAAKLLHLALWIEQSWLCRIMRLTKREDHSKLTPFLPIFKKFSCHINHILRTRTVPARWNINRACLQAAIKQFWGQIKKIPAAKELSQQPNFKFPELKFNR